MWIAIFAAVTVLALISIIYLMSRFHRFRCLKRLGENHKLLSWLLAAVPVAGILSTGYFINLYTMPVVIIYFMLIWMICDFIAWIIRKCRKTEPARYYAGGIALLLTFAVLGAGWYFAHHVYRTSYTFRSEKLAGFQLLDIQDFTGQGTALVGVLDAFMDERRLFCGVELERRV